MTSGEAARHDRFLRLFKLSAESMIDARLARVEIEDENLRGESLVVDGKRLLNFGSCAYLGINLDPRLKEGAVAAVRRFGPVFSSSAAYTSVNLYGRLAERLERIFGARVLLPTTTTLGHLAALPVLVGEGDVVLIDSQAHSSVHLATQVVKAQGIEVRVLPHNDLGALDRALDELTPLHRSVWYLADGIYSMLGDVAPVTEIVERLETYDNFRAYFDDAHGFGWHGLHGRGWVLERVPLHERMIVAVSLSKSFGSGGAAIVVPDEETAQRIQNMGGTMIFSGPIHPAELGAAIASADIHLSPEHEGLRSRLSEQIADVRKAALELELPIPAHDSTPIWFAKVGPLDETLEVARRLLHDGYFVNVAAFPAVPLGSSGMRFTHTLYHDSSQVIEMMEAMACHIGDVMGATESATDPDIVVDITDSAMAASLLLQED